MSKGFRQFAVGYNLALKFGIMISCPILGALFIGIFVDKKLGTTPWVMLLMMAAGIAFSTYAVYRVAQRMQTPDQDKKEQN